MIRTRSSGVLLHPTSLPGPHGNGDLGPSAYHFVDWLVTGGQTRWQVLPLGPVGPGDSPYMSPSAFAGNPLLIDLAALAAAGWLTPDEVAPLPADPHRIDYAAVRAFRTDRLQRAARRFFSAAAGTADHGAFMRFCQREADWLDAELRLIGPGGADAHRFEQWCFDRQWRALRAYANARGVKLIGDLPIFVAADGFEVRAHPELFDLHPDGRPRVVAGVPPDYFSATGQHWGNPLYRWPAHAADGYRWWVARLRRVLSLVDGVRIDHFRGFAACWEIPAEAETALSGRWVSGPGAALFHRLRDELAPAGGALPLIAEDLGIITADVRALRQALHLPGMRVLQFAFDGDLDNPYLPHHFAPDTVVYPGTHDNDTTRGWWQGLDDTTRARVAAYFGRGVDAFGEAPHAHLIRAAFASVADTALVTMQDVLGLGPESRLNRPGEATGQWAWRFTWDQVGPRPAQFLRELATVYGRGAA